MSWRFSPQVRQQLFPQQKPDEDEEVADRDYVNFVRQFRQSELVAMIAAVAPRFSFNQADYQQNSRVTPWGLADVARVSLAFGSERNRLSPTPEDLTRCLLLHNSLGYPGLEEQQSGAVANLFLQLAFSQFPFQRDVGPLTGRSIALFHQTEPADPSGIDVLRGDWQTELLGCSLTEYIGVTQLLMAAAMPNNGGFDPTWIEREDLKDLADIFDPAITRHVLHRYLVADASTFRTRDSTPSISRRFTFNPLIDTPVVSGLGPDLVMPIPDYMIWKPTPSGLSCTGLAKWDQAFTRDLGKLFEAYVGRHLHLLPDAEVHSEIPYRKPKKQWGKSVDWIVIFPDVVLLVEAKAKRSTQALRSGDEGAAAALQQTSTRPTTSSTRPST
jgi:hypothetical protein